MKPKFAPLPPHVQELTAKKAVKAHEKEVKKTVKGHVKAHGKSA
jgi:hypothetical protein